VVAKRLLTVLAGAGASAALAACAMHQVGPKGERDIEAPIIIRGTSANPKTCVVTLKEGEIRAHKGKFLKFRFDNYCEADIVVAVGNFRTVQDPSPAPDNCDKPYSDGLPPIFRETDPEDFKDDIDAGRPDRPKTGRINLQVRERSELGDKLLTYYFDVCINRVIQKDPRLIIEE